MRGIQSKVFVHTVPILGVTAVEFINVCLQTHQGTRVHTQQLGLWYRKLR